MLTQQKYNRECVKPCDKWVPITTAWRVLGFGWRNGLRYGR